MQELICHYQYWFKGCKIPKSGYYPERAWGAYLKGDEPGWMCEILEDYCNDRDCPIEQEVEHGDDA